MDLPILGWFFWKSCADGFGIMRTFDSKAARLRCDWGIVCSPNRGAVFGTVGFTIDSSFWMKGCSFFLPEPSGTFAGNLSLTILKGGAQRSCFPVSADPASGGDPRASKHRSGELPTLSPSETQFPADARSLDVPGAAAVAPPGKFGGVVDASVFRGRNCRPCTNLPGACAGAVLAAGRLWILRGSSCLMDRGENVMRCDVVWSRGGFRLLLSGPHRRWGNASHGPSRYGQSRAANFHDWKEFTHHGVLGAQLLTLTVLQAAPSGHYPAIPHSSYFPVRHSRNARYLLARPGPCFSQKA